jgi:hypothetical protein
MRMEGLSYDTRARRTQKRGRLLESDDRVVLVETDVTLAGAGVVSPAVHGRTGGDRDGSLL